MTMGEYHSRLFYRDTRIEVQLGGEVRIKRWFRNDLDGVVCYLPGISPKHSEMEFEDVQLWGIRLADGSVLEMCYAPEQGQPRRNIVFVRRGNSPGLMPEEELL